MLRFFRLLFAGKTGKKTSLKSQINALEKEVSVLNEDTKEKDKMLQEFQENILKLEAQIKETIENMQIKDKKLENSNEKLQFLASVINANPLKNSAYEKFLNLLHKDYMDYANENDSLAGEAAALLKLQNVQEQLELLSYDETLLNKTIVAVAGSFSSGKSSFMNSFFKSKNVILPRGMDQTTAISTYVINGEESITGYSFKGGCVNIPENVFNLFSYGKIKEFNFNMKQIINHIVFRSEFVKDFTDLCFVDTPGFNPGKETESDYESATRAISSANAVIWCVDCSSGTIKSDELDILYDIFCKNEKLKIYIVLNKADLKSYEENCAVLDDVENQLNLQGILFDGITLYSSNYVFDYSLINQPEECKYFKGMSLFDFLESNNHENVQRKENLLKILDDVFNDYINADEQRIKKLENQIRTLKILELSFSNISNSKDEQLSYYKARVDRKHYKLKNFEDDSLDDEDLYNGLADLKLELKKTIEKDTEDIEKARNLCFAMKKSVAEVFGQELKKNDTLSVSEHSKSSDIKEKHYCKECGEEVFSDDSEFCHNCGKPLFVEKKNHTKMDNREILMESADEKNKVIFSIIILLKMICIKKSKLEIDDKKLK